MTRCARSCPTRMIRAALAAALPLALGACANGIDTKPDKPFHTANVCTDSAIPAGWVRTNDWRAKGCGIAESDAAHDKVASNQKPGVKFASAKATSAKADPSADTNNWMTIADLDRTRIGRSLTACVGAVPAGWIETARYWDKGRCGNPTKPIIKNVMLIERVK